MLEVMSMVLPETELLQYVHKTADMGCEGIHSVLEYTENIQLKKALEEQLFEYQNLRRKAAELLNKRGEKPSNAGTIAKMSSGIMAIGKLMIDRSDSKIAEMTIQGNNLGVNKTLRHLHDYDGEDKEVKNLTEKLLATEENNVEKLKMFL